MYARRIALMLGDSVVSIEIKDDLHEFIELSLDEIKPYISSSCITTVPYSPCIDLKDIGAYAVTNVFATSAANDLSLSVNGVGMSTESLVFSANNVQRLGTYPGSRESTWNSSTLFDNMRRRTLIAKYVNTVSGKSTSISFQQYEHKLYCELPDGTGTASITIEYTPDYQSVDQVSDPYWQNYLFRLSLANCKIALGRIRGKYRLNNPAYDMDADQLLSEGIEERNQLLNELEESRDITIIMD